eukprot:scaffold5303_cov97-Skeletonema_dohrnii-CCMP3373.AAC.4
MQNAKYHGRVAMANNCGFTEGGEWQLFCPAPSASNFGRLSSATLIAPDGTRFENLNEGVALAAHYGCSVNLAPYYETFDEGPPALQKAIDIGLQPGWAVKYHYRRNGTIEGVGIWSPRGEWYQSYHDLVNDSEFEFSTITCPWFMERCQKAAVDYFLPPGWAACLGNGNKKRVTSPEGDKYASHLQAMIVAGVARPSAVLVREVVDYQRAVRGAHPRSTNFVMSSTKLALLAGVSVDVLRNLLRGNDLKSPQGLFSISRFFEERNAVALEQAARAEGVTDIARYERLMSVARTRRMDDRVYEYTRPVPESRSAYSLQLQEQLGANPPPPPPAALVEAIGIDDAPPLPPPPPAALVEAIGIDDAPPLPPLPNNAGEAPVDGAIAEV